VAFLPCKDAEAIGCVLSRESSGRGVGFKQETSNAHGQLEHVIVPVNDQVGKVVSESIVPLLGSADYIAHQRSSIFCDKRAQQLFKFPTNLLIARERYTSFCLSTGEVNTNPPVLVGRQCKGASVIPIIGPKHRWLCQPLSHFAG